MTVALSYCPLVVVMLSQPRLVADFAVLDLALALHDHREAVEQSAVEHPGLVLVSLEPLLVREEVGPRLLLQVHLLNCPHLVPLEHIRGGTGHHALDFLRELQGPATLHRRSSLQAPPERTPCRSGCGTSRSRRPRWGDRKSTRLNSSHVKISY